MLRVNLGVVLWALLEEVVHSLAEEGFLPLDLVVHRPNQAAQENIPQIPCHIEDHEDRILDLRALCAIHLSRHALRLAHSLQPDRPAHIAVVQSDLHQHHIRVLNGSIRIHTHTRTLDLLAHHPVSRIPVPDIHLHLINLPLHLQSTCQIYRLLFQADIVFHQPRTATVMPKYGNWRNKLRS
jgi:hypothetical protein